MRQPLLIALVVFSLGAMVHAEENAEPVEQLHEQTPETKKEEPTHETTVPPSLEATHEKEKSEKWSPGVGKLLSMGARIDSNFSGGGAIQQGFSIPSIRLTAFGEAGKNVDYRLSFGQTREYSTALLPQMLPTEAYVDLATNPPRDGNEREGSDIRLRTGMMAPLFNPWWSPDLGDLKMIDYHETHKALFVSREIGAEVAFRPIGDKLTLAAGAFNGSGIVSLNTNNSKAFTGHLHAIIPLGAIRVGIGNGTYYSEQSTKGAINYKRLFVTDFFGYLEIVSLKAVLCLDTFTSTYEDPTRAITPQGTALMAMVPLTSWMSVFGRVETATDSPLSGHVRNFQLGPTVEISDYLKLFFTYQTLTANSSDQRQVQFRVRLTI